MTAKSGALNSILQKAKDRRTRKENEECTTDLVDNMEETAAETPNRDLDLVGAIQTVSKETLNPFNRYITYFAY